MSYYKDYHDPRYIWAALGWFTACAFSGLVRRKHQGFPTLNLYGLSGCGKSELIHKVLAMHYGCKPELGFSGSSPFAIQQHLASNTIFPCCIDEFRAGEDDYKLKAVQQIIRSLYDDSIVSKGRSDLTVHNRRLIGVLSIVGEHCYEDEASVQRTFQIGMDRTYISKLNNNEALKKKAHIGYRWLHNSEHKGKLGNILLRHIENNYDIVDECIDLAEKVVDDLEDEYPIKVERKKKGYIAVISGLIFLRHVYRLYGLEFPAKLVSEIIPFIYQANPRETYDTSSDKGTFESLFDITDHVFTTEKRARRSIRGTVAELDNDDSEIIYLELRRWYKAVQSQVKGGVLSAALSQQESFNALLRHNFQSDPKTVIVDLIPGEKTGRIIPFRGYCVVLDLRKVRERYQVSTDWLDVVDMSGEF